MLFVLDVVLQGRDIASPHLVDLRSQCFHRHQKTLAATGHGPRVRQAGGKGPELSVRPAICRIAGKRVLELDEDKMSSFLAVSRKALGGIRYPQTTNLKGKRVSTTQINGHVPQFCSRVAVWGKALRQIRGFGCMRFSGGRAIDDCALELQVILWMDEILHHLKNLGMIIPLYIPANNVFSWF